MSKTNKNFSEYVKQQAAAYNSDKRRVTSSEATYKTKGTESALVYSQLKSGEPYITKMTSSEMSRERSKKQIKKSNSRLKKGEGKDNEPYEVISHKLNQKFSDLDENVVTSDEPDSSLLPKIVNGKKPDPSLMTF